jgi:hypothetical protein
VAVLFLSPCELLIKDPTRENHFKFKGHRGSQKSEFAAAADEPSLKIHQKHFLHSLLTLFLVLLLMLSRGNHEITQKCARRERRRGRNEHCSLPKITSGNLFIYFPPSHTRTRSSSNGTRKH